MPFSDFENVACIKRYKGKTIKIVLSLKYLYFINDSIHQSENLVPQFYASDLTFISDDFFSIFDSCGDISVYLALVPGQVGPVLHGNGFKG